MTDQITFQDLFDLEQIQAIQDAFAEATGVASIITETDGTPITQPSNFCRLCQDIIRGTEKGLANCMQSDAALGQVNPDGPIVQPCLSGGLWDGGASITVGDRHIANWLIGQVRDESIEEDKLIDYAHEIGADETEFREALAEVTVMPSEQFEKVSHALFLIARQMSDLAQTAMNQRQARQEQARLQEQVIEAQRAALRELSTPIIPIFEGIIILPLVGGIDSARARDVMRSLLAGIGAYRAKVVILDITGVPLVDSGVADHLNRAMQAARLKGSRTIVSGISDAVAETIVELGIDWSGVHTVRDLQTGLLYALESLGRRIC